MALLLSVLVDNARVEFTKIFSFVTFFAWNCILGVPEKLICFERFFEFTFVWVRLGCGRVTSAMGFALGKCCGTWEMSFVWWRFLKSRRVVSKHFSKFYVFRGPFWKTTRIRRGGDGDNALIFLQLQNHFELIFC